MVLGAQAEGEIFGIAVITQRLVGTVIRVSFYPLAGSVYGELVGGAEKPIIGKGTRCNIMGKGFGYACHVRYPLVLIASTALFIDVEEIGSQFLAGTKSVEQPGSCCNVS